MEQTRVITLNTNQSLEQIDNYNQSAETEYLSEVLLEFYKNGTYSYSQYRENDQPVAPTARQQKGKVAKWMKEPTTKKYLGSMMRYLFETDEVLPQQLRRDKIQLRNRINELQNQLSSFEQTQIDLKETAIQNEVELRLEHYVEERDDRIKKQSGRIQDLTAKNHILEQTIQDQRNKINDLIKEKNDTQLGLEVECKKVKKKLKKQNKKKKKKKKKSYSSSDSDSSDSDYEYNNVSGGD